MVVYYKKAREGELSGRGRRSVGVVSVGCAEKGERGSESERGVSVEGSEGEVVVYYKTPPLGCSRKIKKF